MLPLMVTMGNSYSNQVNLEQILIFDSIQSDGVKKGLGMWEYFCGFSYTLTQFREIAILCGIAPKVRAKIINSLTVTRV